MRRNQMFGALGHRRLERLRGGAAGVKRCRKLPPRAADLADQNAGEQQDQRHAAEIDGEQDAAGLPRHRCLPRQPRPLLDLHPGEIRGNGLRRATGIGDYFSRRSGAAACAAKTDQFVAVGELALRQRARFLQQPALCGFIDSADQGGEVGRNRISRPAKFLGKARIAG
jgi:hypothetical protein